MLGESQSFAIDLAAGFLRLEQQQHRQHSVPALNSAGEQMKKKIYTLPGIVVQ
jgi:hypothetical protein